MQVSVVVEVNNVNLDRPFDYMVDFSMQEDISIGKRVLVPFGSRNVEGFVVGISEISMDNLKPILKIYDECINTEQMSIVNFLRKRNSATMIECFNTILPPALRASVKNKDKIKMAKYVEVVDFEYNGSEKELELIKLLSDGNILLKDANMIYSAYTVNKLRKLNVIKVVEKEIHRKSYLSIENKLYDEPTSDQLEVINNITNSSNLYHLINAPTGSGKTICYIELIKNCLKNNQDVLVLVPEITLTTQFINALQFHLNSEIAVFHSKMSQLERYDNYRLVQSGLVRVALGTRSAVFLPFNNLGLIIIDEEHDASFIQEQSVSYSAKEIAMLRSKFNHSKLVLGSATPDVITYYNSLEKNIDLHLLTKKFSTTKHVTEVIDMKSNFDWILSKTLLSKIASTLDKKEQFVLLLNRRGYASYLVCNDCGQALKCPNCDVTLTLHQNNELKCHHCNYSTYKKQCGCGSDNLEDYGYGIQKVEEMLLNEFPSLRVKRVDTDTTSKLNSTFKIFESFKNQELDCLIGTQILSKGLNFPGVSLVAILDADYSLNINSYKASERTFQYINQSIGRGGRGSHDVSQNIVQTFDVNHYAFRYALDSNYTDFYNEEIKFRKQFNYPPFTKYFKIYAKSANLSKLVAYMNKLYNQINFEHISVTKPQFCNIERIYNQYQMQILVKHSKNDEMFDIIKYVRASQGDREIKVLINTNPINF